MLAQVSESLMPIIANRCMALRCTPGRSRWVFTVPMGVHILRNKTSSESSREEIDDEVDNVRLMYSCYTLRHNGNALSQRLMSGKTSYKVVGRLTYEVVSILLSARQQSCKRARNAFQHGGIHPYRPVDWSPMPPCTVLRRTETGGLAFAGQTLMCRASSRAAAGSKTFPSPNEAGNLPVVMR